MVMSKRMTFWGAWTWMWQEIVAIEVLAIEVLAIEVLAIEVLAQVQVRVRVLWETRRKLELL
jgi:hypothetical protein